MNTSFKGYRDISRQRMTVGIALALLLLLGAYFLLYMRFPQKVRYLAVGFVAVCVLITVMPEPRFWMHLLPFLFLLGSYTYSFMGFNPSVSTIVMMLFTFYYVSCRILWNRPLFIPSKYLFFLLLAFLLQAVSIVISIHVHRQFPLNALRDGSSIFLFAPLAVAVPVLCKEQVQLDKLVKVLVTAVFVAALLGVVQYFSITTFSRVDLSLGYIYRGRVSSFFGNPNIFAGYLELGIPLAIGLLVREKNLLWKGFSVATIVLSFLSVLYTFSRGGLICTFIGSSIVTMYIFRKRLWVPILFGVAAIYFLVSNADTFERQMSFILNPREQMHQPTILHRYVAYQGYLNQIEESPLTGVGYGARSYFWGRSRLYSFWEGRFTRSTRYIKSFGGLNSLLLNNAVKGGLISVFSVVLLFFTVFALCINGIKRSKNIIPVAITAGLVSFTGHQFFDNLMRFPTVGSFFWFLVG
ncbi:MAG: hypothetical protein GF388_01220, partial [Candidatus Aegiribacteria sp.]|nr:hypothetical protein [Candidatus Aegiribacteria sp.]MBD3294002.1 hypothetical protein [Candidatus Fermentibacteria bacterium]